MPPAPAFCRLPPPYSSPACNGNIIFSGTLLLPGIQYNAACPGTPTGFEAFITPLSEDPLQVHSIIKKTSQFGHPALFEFTHPSASQGAAHIPVGDNSGGPVENLNQEIDRSGLEGDADVVDDKQIEGLETKHLLQPGVDPGPVLPGQLQGASGRTAHEPWRNKAAAKDCGPGHGLKA